MDPLRAGTVPSGCMAADGFAVIAYRDDGVWRCERLAAALVDDLDGCVQALHHHRDATVLVDVDDEFFVALRGGPGRSDVRLLLSDVTAAADYDLARQALDLLGEEQPSDDDLDEVWPAGDLGLFVDLGLDERELRAILDDLDLYADEMIVAIAGRVGFRDAYAAAVDGPH